MAERIAPTTHAHSPTDHRITRDAGIAAEHAGDCCFGQLVAERWGIERGLSR